MDQRLSLVLWVSVTSTVLESSTNAIGLPGESPDGEVVLFQAGGMIVALWSRDLLRGDSVVDRGGWGGVTLAYNASSSETVNAVADEARAAGETIAREDAATFLGGYSAVFVDPDGLPWEVAHNRGWELQDDGSVRLHW